MNDLGIMNGWKDEPQAYTKHLATCGEPYTYKHCLGKPGHSEMRTNRRYNEARTSLGHCYNQYTCQDCGISYKVDSSG